MTEMQNAHELLLEARDLIASNTWIRGMGGGPERYCAVGALVRANFNSPRRVGYGAAQEALVNAVGTTAVGDWNDTRGSVDEVLAAFDQAIETTAPARELVAA